MADAPATAGRRRIGLVAHRLAGPTPTGIGRYYREIVAGLAAAAEPTTSYVVASTRERSTPTWIPPGVEQRAFAGPRKLRAAAWAALRWPPVDRELGHPDLVHLLHAWAPVPAKAPLVVTVHDLFPLLHPEWQSRLEGWAYGRAVSMARDVAAAIVVPSGHTAAAVSTHLGIEPERLRVVWNGVGDEFRRRAGPDEQAEVCARHGVEPGRYLVAVGAVSARKNLPVVLRALTLVDPAALGATALLVVGPRGHGAPAIERTVDDLGLGARVRFAGFVPDGDLPVLVGASAGLVHPSLEEGFGITPLEAMAAGVPAVASAVGSVPEVTGASAVLVAADDVDGWAAAITTITTDAERRAALVAAGDAHQARFTWRRTAEETAAVHAEVLGR